MSKKTTPYQQYVQSSQWRQRLFKKATHKALDIPEDDVNINVQKGITWKEIATAGALLLASAIAAGQYFQPSTPGVDSTTGTQEFEVRFFDAEGNEINVPHADTTITKQ